MNYLIEDLKHLYLNKKTYLETLDETKSFQVKHLKTELEIVLSAILEIREQEQRIESLENTISNNKFFFKQKDYNYYEQVADNLFSLYVLNNGRNKTIRNALFLPTCYTEMLDRKMQWKKELDEWQLKNYPNLNIQDEKINKLFQEVRGLKLEAVLECNIDKI